MGWNTSLWLINLIDRNALVISLLPANEQCRLKQLRIRGNRQKRGKK